MKSQESRENWSVRRWKRRNCREIRRNLQNRLLLREIRRNLRSRLRMSRQKNVERTLL
jgi:hypothetical protein